MRADEAKTAPTLKLFEVGIDDEDSAVSAVLALYPELAAFHLTASETISPTAVELTELQAGEVREDILLGVLFRKRPILA